MRRSCHSACCAAATASTSPTRPWSTAGSSWRWRTTATRCLPRARVIGRWWCSSAATTRRCCCRQLDWWRTSATWWTSTSAAPRTSRGGATTAPSCWTMWSCWTALSAPWSRASECPSRARFGCSPRWRTPSRCAKCWRQQVHHGCASTDERGSKRATASAPSAGTRSPRCAATCACPCSPTAASGRWRTCSRACAARAAWRS
mmetsp:Transcript_4897/g.15826  ORF Transcript_4897/g.15826 Transcript_4897/m.15826 type:complete len:203 (+) Transcript_4897:134-742(+)